MDAQGKYTVFVGMRRIAGGELRNILGTAKEHIEAGGSDLILIFDDQTGQQVDFDTRGTVAEVLERYAPVAPPRSGPGRPKLGVVSREVTLLPRHWQWLEQQPQGISAALRRLVEEAKRRAPDTARAHMARDAASRFMWAMAGNLPGFEEASRALFAGDGDRFDELIRAWPEDIRAHLTGMAGEALRSAAQRVEPSMRDV